MNETLPEQADLTRAIDVLFVCTANQVRSPMAAAMFSRQSELRRPGAVVASAGLLDSGSGAADATIRVLARRGIDLRTHLSRRVDAELLTCSRLILGMERMHVREVVVLQPSVWPRTFTLKELVRRGRAAGPRTANETLDLWLARVAQGRTHRDILGSSPTDDVRDPIGGPDEEFEDAAVEIQGLVLDVVDLVVARSR